MKENPPDVPLFAFVKSWAIAASLAIACLRMPARAETGSGGANRRGASPDPIISIGGEGTHIDIMPILRLGGSYPVALTLHAGFGTFIGRERFSDRKLFTLFEAGLMGWNSDLLWGEEFPGGRGGPSFLWACGGQWHGDWENGRAWNAGPQVQVGFLGFVIHASLWCANGFGGSAGLALTILPLTENLDARY